MIEELGEVNMADGDTLVEFVTWAVENYPARKTALILSDHGAGWPGGFGDPDPGIAGADDIFLLNVFGADNLWLMEIDRTLAAALEATGLESFDFVGFDACLMAQVEVFTAIAPYAQYSVASEETEPGVGWAYTAVLESLTADPTVDGGGLAQLIVESYIDYDMRLNDPDFVGDLDPAQAAVEFFHDATLTAVDLSAIADLNTALDSFADSLTQIDQKLVARARSYAQAYESVFGDEFPSPYIDLGNFASLIAQQSNSEVVSSAAEALQAAIANAVIAERHGPGRSGSTGIAIYFPVPDMVEIGENFGYAEVADRFAAETNWDEFLTFHAGGGAPVSFNRPEPSLAQQLLAAFDFLTEEDVQALIDEIATLQAEEYTPDEIAATLLDEEWDGDVVDFLVELGVLAPPAEPVQLSSAVKPIRVAPITLSAEVVRPGEPVTVQSEISGDQIGYVYTFIGRYLPDENVLIIEDQDYIFSDDDQEVGGVVYPVWPEESFPVEYEWEPTVYAASDGESSVRVLFMPESYGESPVYTVDGIYQSVNGGDARYARLYFMDGEGFQVIAFTGAASSSAGAPYELTPKPGDTFTVLEQGINLAAAEGEDDSYRREAGTLTFGDEPFTLETTPAPSGNYVVGILAEDLQGNTYEQYESVFVVNDEAEAEEGYLPYANEDQEFALLYPEAWTLYEDAAISLVSEDESAFVTVERLSYEDLDGSDASDQAISDALDNLGDGLGVENVEFADEISDILLGWFDARTVEFSGELDGFAVSGSVSAATPTLGLTFVVISVAQDDVYEDTAPLFDAIVYSFDVLISGIERAAASPPPPALAEIIFSDDFSDAESGLYEDEEPQDWGQGYYDLDNEYYVYDLTPEPGAIYDYYGDVELEAPFLYQGTVTYFGTWNNAYGLTFQVVSDDEFYAFRISGDGYFIVEKSSADGVETLVDWTIADSIAQEEETPNTLAVVGNEGYYDLYINDGWVGSFEDDSYSGGSVGIIAENLDSEDFAVFIFDDLTVGVPEE